MRANSSARKRLVMYNALKVKPEYVKRMKRTTKRLRQTWKNCCLKKRRGGRRRKSGPKEEAEVRWWRN
jgi:hypothetical protein